MKVGPEGDQNEILIRNWAFLDKGDERYLEWMHGTQRQRGPTGSHGPCCKQNACMLLSAYYTPGEPFHRQGGTSVD